MDQHFVKKPSKSRLGGTKIEVWRALGQVWRRLGQSWAILDVCGSVLDRLENVLEASWKPPGPFWAEKAGQHGSKMAPKTEAKSIKKQSKNRSLVGCHLESPFVGFPPIFGIKNRIMLVRKCIQKSIRS